MDSYNDGFNDGWTPGKEYQFKRDMKAKQEEVNVYSALGVCVCVLGWIYLALIIFPK